MSIILNDTLIAFYDAASAFLLSASQSQRLVFAAFQNASTRICSHLQLFLTFPYEEAFEQLYHKCFPLQKLNKDRRTCFRSSLTYLKLPHLLLAAHSSSPHIEAHQERDR